MLTLHTLRCHTLQYGATPYITWRCHIDHSHRVTASQDTSSHGLSCDLISCACRVAASAHDNKLKLLGVILVSVLMTIVRFFEDNSTAILPRFMWGEEQGRPTCFEHFASALSLQFLLWRDRQSLCKDFSSFMNELLKQMRLQLHSWIRSFNYWTSMQLLCRWKSLCTLTELPQKAFVFSLGLCRSAVNFSMASAPNKE